MENRESRAAGSPPIALAICEIPGNVRRGPRLVKQLVESMMPGTAFRPVELLGNHPTVPRHDGIRERDAGHQLEVLAAKTLPDLSQGRALRVGEAEPRRKTRAADIKPVPR
jgi:hypothetical protein